MKRTKTIALFLVVVLVLAAAVAPVVIAQTQFGLATNNTQRSASLFTIGASAPPVAIACGGCSGGGTGPE